MYFIYVLENRINGKRYVGQTKNPSIRKRQHSYSSSKCPYIANAIQKYGWDNFEFIVLEEHEKLSKANRKEKYWIRKLNTLSPNGYNLREGGDAGGKPSQETIEKIRKANLGRVQSEEEKEKRAASHRGRKNTPETIEKMRVAAINRPPENALCLARRDQRNG